MWGLEPSQQCKNFLGIIVLQFVSHLPGGYRIWFYGDCVPPTIFLQLLLCPWMWGIFFWWVPGVDYCSTASCDLGTLVEDERTSFYSATLNQSPAYMTFCVFRIISLIDVKYWLSCFTMMNVELILYSKLWANMYWLILAKRLLMEVCGYNAQWGQTSWNVRVWSRERLIARPGKETGGSCPKTARLPNGFPQNILKSQVRKKVS